MARSCPSIDRKGQFGPNTLRLQNLLLVNSAPFVYSRVHESRMEPAMTETTLLFTAGEVQDLVGVSQRQLTHWDASGLIHPGGKTAHGRGSRRMYTLRDIIQLKVIMRLRSAKLPLQRVRKALSVLETLPMEPAPLAELEILTDGRRLLIRRSNEDLLDPIARQYVLRLPLSVLLAEVEQRVKAESLEQETSKLETGLCR